MNEIEWLMDHYLRLLNSNGETYEESLKGAHSTKNKYLSFLLLLSKVVRRIVSEDSIIQTLIKFQFQCTYVYHHHSYFFEALKA